MALSTHSRLFCAARAWHGRGLVCYARSSEGKEASSWQKSRYQAQHPICPPYGSQLLIPYDESVHRRNLVNPTASHVSGAVQWHDGEGETDEELVLRLLDRIKPSGPNPPADPAPNV